MALQVTPEEQQISDLARADAVHDFQSLGPRSEGDIRLAIFNKSVRTRSTTLYDVKGLLNILLGATPWEDGARAKNGGPAFPINGINYTVKSFKIEDVEGMYIPGLELARRMGLPEKCAFVVDVNQHGIIARLKHGEHEVGSKTPPTIYHLSTPEVINDPAGKTSYKDSVFGNPTGANIVPCVEVRESPITFPGSQPFNATANAFNLFYTKYTTTLSPIQGFPLTDEGRQLQVNLTIDDKSGNRAELKNSKASNSVQAIKGVLVRIYNNFLNMIGAKQEKVDDKTVFSVASAWLQKRSGDWLQAIAARSIPGRTFVNGKNLAEAPFKIPVKVPVYFVTHDQIATTYALMIGCNVIFLTTSSATSENSFVFTRTDAVGEPDYTIVQSELEEQIKKITAKEKAAEAFLKAQLTDASGKDPFLLNAADLDKINAQVQEIFKMMLERTYASECLEKYRKLLAGLKGDDIPTKYSCLYYAKLENEAFSVEPIKKEKIYETASAWTYSYDLPRTDEKIVTRLPEKYYDFLVRIGTLAEPAVEHGMTPKRKMADAFRSFPGELDAQSKTQPDKELQYGRMIRSFKLISSLIDAYLRIGAIPEDESEFEMVFINLRETMRDIAINEEEKEAMVDFFIKHNSDEMFADLSLEEDEGRGASASASSGQFISPSQEESVMAMMGQHVQPGAEGLVDQPVISALTYGQITSPGVPAAAPTAVPTAPFPVPDITAFQRQAELLRQRSRGKKGVQGPFQQLGDDMDTSPPTTSISGQKDRTRRQGGAEQPSLDTRISAVDRIMPIIRRLNTFKVNSTITKDKSNAFLLSPIVAILYGLEGSIEKLEGSPDLAMYGRYVALLKHMSNMITTNEHRQLAWEFLTSEPKHREQIAGLFGISKEDYLLTGMISFGISQSLFGNVPGEPTKIATLERGSLAKLWNASDEGTTMNYEQIVTAYQNLRKDTFSKISQSVTEYPSPPTAPAVQATSLITTPPKGDEPTTPPRKIQSAPMEKKPTAKDAPWGNRQGIRHLEPHTPSAVHFNGLVAAAAGRKTYRKKTKHSKTSRGLKTYRKKPKRSKSSRHTRRVRRPGLSKEFETQVSP